MTPPANLEKCDQLVPNWNSIGMPVTTPKTKLMPKIFAQKRAAWSYRSSFFQSPMVFSADDQRSQSHGELWKQVMEGNSECEMQSMYQYGGVH